MSLLNFAKITELREKLGITQEQASQKAGFKSRQQWNAIEAGRQPVITTDTLQALADALGCNPADLLHPPARHPRRTSRSPRRRPAPAAGK